MQIPYKSEKSTLAKGGQAYDNSGEGAGRGEAFPLQPACAHDGKTLENVSYQDFAMYWCGGQQKYRKGVKMNFFELMYEYSGMSEWRRTCWWQVVYLHPWERSEVEASLCYNSSRQLTAPNDSVIVARQKYNRAASNQGTTDYLVRKDPVCFSWLISASKLITQIQFLKMGTQCKSKLR